MGSLLRVVYVCVCVVLLCSQVVRLCRSLYQVLPPRISRVYPPSGVARLVEGVD